MENEPISSQQIQTPNFSALPDLPRTLPVPSPEIFAMQASKKQEIIKIPLKTNATPIKARRKIGKIHKRAIRKPGMRFGRWDAAEHRRFLEAMEKYGNSWKLVCEYIKTRTADQIRSHAQKYYEGIKSRLIKEMKEDPEQKRAIFVVTREYWNTNGLTRAFEKSPSANAEKKESEKVKMENSSEKASSPKKIPRNNKPKESPKSKSCEKEMLKSNEFSENEKIQVESPHTSGTPEKKSLSSDIIKCTAFYPVLPQQPRPKVGIDPAWLMLAQSCALANSMLLNGLKQYTNNTVNESKP